MQKELATQLFEDMAFYYGSQEYKRDRITELVENIEGCPVCNRCEEIADLLERLAGIGDSYINLLGRLPNEDSPIVKSILEARALAAQLRG